MVILVNLNITSLLGVIILAVNYEAKLDQPQILSYFDNTSLQSLIAICIKS